MLCPSSPLPQTEILRNAARTRRITSVVPSYVGISGATNHFANRLANEVPFLGDAAEAGEPRANAAANGPSSPADVAAIVGRHARARMNATAWRPPSTARRTRWSSPRRATISIRATQWQEQRAPDAHRRQLHQRRHRHVHRRLVVAGHEQRLDFRRPARATTYFTSYNVTTLRAYTEPGAGQLDDWLQRQERELQRRQGTRP